jgi:hypothetical protein
VVYLDYKCCGITQHNLVALRTAQAAAQLLLHKSACHPVAAGACTAPRGGRSQPLARASLPRAAGAFRFTRPRPSEVFPPHQEYRRIVLKTAGAADRVRELLSNMARVEKACLYGSFTCNQTDARSDVFGRHLATRTNHGVFMKEDALRFDRLASSTPRRSSAPAARAGSHTPGTPGI